MESEEFEALLGAFRAEKAGRQYPPEFQLFDSWTATQMEIAAAEATLATRLPLKYKHFMQVFGGGGEFAFVDLLPVRSPDGRDEDLLP